MERSEGNNRGTDAEGWERDGGEERGGGDEDHLDQLLPQHPVRVPTTEVGGEQADG